MIKHSKDHLIKISPVCGKLFEILTNRDNPDIDIAMVYDIQPTTAHYHLGFQEIYLVLDGMVHLELYNPESDLVSNTTLGPNELIVFKPGIHHRVIDASEKNRLCVISLPGFNPADEHVSDKMQDRTN